MIVWSKEMAKILKIDKIETDLLSGNKLCTGMAPYAQCYGGHQFGAWAGQLGDGRAITLGEINSEFGKLELQLKRHIRDKLRCKTYLHFIEYMLKKELQKFKFKIGLLLIEHQMNIISYLI